MKRLSLALLMLLFLTGCTTVPHRFSNEEVIDLQNKNNIEATTALVKTLKEKGFTTQKISPTQFLIRYNEHDFLMEPKIVEDGLSRIIVSRLFKIKEEYQESPELFVLIIALNRHLNFAKFSMLPENRAGQVQTAITFVDETIQILEIQQFLIWMDDSLNKIKNMVPPEALHMLENETN
uniref:Lipoprotein n=1 Tax=Hydrogenovibrio crunogenus (strain DSM 25203 / XCL-2) TaxID=317025 RepID=Q31ED3_HYDCU